MRIWIHLNDGTFFSGDPLDEVQGPYDKIKLMYLREGDLIRVAGSEPTLDFLGETKGIYRVVLLVRRTEV